MLRLSREKLLLKVLVCLVVLAFTSSGFCAGLQSSRIMPSGKVFLYKDGQKVGEFSAESQLPQGYYLETEDRCAVKMEGLYLVAEGDSLFSIDTLSDRRELRLMRGTVYFALSNLPKSLVFSTPEMTLTADRVIVNAAVGSLLKGYVSVNDEKAEVGVIEGGSMHISSTEGERTLQAGQLIKVARSNQKGGASGATREAATKAGNVNSISAGSGTSSALVGGVIAAGVVVAGATALAIGISSDSGGDDNEASSFTP